MSLHVQPVYSPNGTVLPEYALPGQAKRPRRRGLLGFLVGLVVGAIGCFFAAPIVFSLFLPGALGEDPRVDEVYALCEEGQMDACDLLYYESQMGSELEEFSKTCGDRVANAEWDYCMNINPEAEANSLNRA